MKPIYKLLAASFLATTLTGVASASTFWDSTLTVQGQTLDLGAAGRTTDYAVFTTGGNFTASSAVSGEIDVVGNVAVNGNSLALANSVIQGNATLASNGKYSLSGGAAITGSRLQGKTYDSSMAQGLTDANTFTSRVSKLTATNNYTTTGMTMGGSLVLNNQTVTISAKDNNPVVLKLQAASVTNSTVTLNGSSSSHFIFDITGSMAMASNSKLLLTGGLLAGNVVFVLEGNNNASLSGNSILNAIVVDAGGNAALSGGAEVDGEVIAKTLSLSGGSKVKKPKNPSM